jgi:hypothetical protein
MKSRKGIQAEKGAKGSVSIQLVYSTTAIQLCIGCAHIVCASSPARTAHNTRQAGQSAAFARARACRVAARGSCDARKQRVYTRSKRSVTGMRSVNSRIKSNCKGGGRGESVPSSFALSTAASTCSSLEALRVPQPVCDGAEVALHDVGHELVPVMLRHTAPTVVDGRDKAEQEGGQGATAASALCVEFACAGGHRHRASPSSLFRRHRV